MRPELFEAWASDDLEAGVILTCEVTCQTCRERTATFLGSLEGEAWVACSRCREQAARVKSKARFVPLGVVEAKRAVA